MKKLVTISILTMLSLIAFADSDTKSESGGAFDRGFEAASWTFIPKGTIAVGLNASYNSVDMGKGPDDSGYTMMFGLVGGVRGNMFTLGVAPHVSYFVADNLAIGGRFDYNRSFFGLEKASLSLGEDLGFSVQDQNMFQHRFSGSVILRYYMAIGGSKRFGLFVEGRATGEYGQAKSWKVVDDKKFGTYSEIKEGALGFVPGLCVFIADNAAVEVAIGVLGLAYSRVDQYTNQIHHSSKTASSANFKINPMTIELGTSFFF